MKSANSKKSKEEVYWKVLQAAIELDFKKGHQKWTISDVSRASGVTRSLIYYYFGRSRAALLEEAVKVIGSEVFGLTDERLEMWKKGRMLESALLSKQTAQQYPFLISFYFTHRFRQNAIGGAIRELEKKHYKKVSQFFSNVSEEQLHKQLAVLFGSVLCPHIESTSELFSNLKSLGDAKS